MADKLIFLLTLSALIAVSASTPALRYQGQQDYRYQRQQDNHYQGQQDYRYQRQRDNRYQGQQSYMNQGNQVYTSTQSDSEGACYAYLTEALSQVKRMLMITPLKDLMYLDNHTMYNVVNNHVNLLNLNL